MFLGERRSYVERLVLAENEDVQRGVISEMEPLQRADFVGIMMAMSGLPVTIRLLDPPLHEFLPQSDNKKGQEEVAKQLGSTVAEVAKMVHELHEFNPMLGFRGCRLGIEYPEITEMQARAIFRAVVAVKKRGITVLPEVMIPLVGDVSELRIQKALVVRVAEDVKKESGIDFEYMVGTMIELPRAALTADKIAAEAEFFSFGTNDLTQTTFGMSRDDAGKFLPKYVEQKLLPEVPFQVLDQEGVGQLVRMGVERGRSTRPGMKTGICGEHGGEAASVKFCHNTGLNYVSCSPYRVVIARLAAAQAVLEAKK
jgi:pyruvate,orthophosphate dikinase